MSRNKTNHGKYDLECKNEQKIKSALEVIVAIAIIITAIAIGSLVSPFGYFLLFGIILPLMAWSHDLGKEQGEQERKERDEREKAKQISKQEEITISKSNEYAINRLRGEQEAEKLKNSADNGKDQLIEKILPATHKLLSESFVFLD